MATDERDKLESLLCDVFLIDPDEFTFDLTRDEIDSWDSLALISVGLGIEERFGRRLPAEQLGQVESLRDFCELLGIDPA